MLLVAMALYDLAAVLLPGGPLRLLVELAISRDEDIPALVYEARPVIHNDSDSSGNVVQRRVWRERSDTGSEGNENANSGTITSSSNDQTFLGIGSGQSERNLVDAGRGWFQEGMLSSLHH